ncbi:MAG: tetratricopeptide repeat protein [Bacteroidota bacterium]|jgi:hypothetical protein
MSDLDRVQALIAEGEKGSAIRLLASMLLQNKNDLDAWLLLGELIDDPSRKRDCYRQALKLSPNHPKALAGLKELEEPGKPPEPEPAPLPITAGPEAEPVDVSASAKETKPTIRPVPHQSVYPAPEHARSKLEILTYVIGGIAVFLVLMYVITRPAHSPDDISNPSTDINNLYIALFFISLIAVMIVLTVADRNRR